MSSSTDTPNEAREPGEAAGRIALAAPTSIAAFALLTAICLTFTLVPLRSSHDEWWHLKSGRWIDENGLPENDVFTYTAEDVAWHNHEWLSQLGMWRIFRWGEVRGLGGVRAVIVFKAAFVTLTFLGLALFTARMTGAPALAALAAALACALSRRTLYPRPPFISYGLLALTLCLLIAWRRGKIPSAGLLVLPPLFAAWANLHGGFMAGLVLGAAFWAEASADWALAVWRMEPTGPAKKRWAWITGAGILSALATLLTPYGYHLYILATRVLSDDRLAGIIFELQPADWNYVWILDACVVIMIFCAFRPRRWGRVALTAGAAALALFLMRGLDLFARGEDPAAWTAAWELNFRETIALIAFAAAGARCGAKIGLGHTLALFFFAHQGIQHVRHLPLLAVVAAPAMAIALEDWVRSTVGGFDWLWKWGLQEHASAAQQIELRSKRLQFAQTFALISLMVVCAFYLALPEEVRILTLRGAGVRPWRDRLGAQSLLDRNVRLISGGDRSPFDEPGAEPGAYPKAAVDFLIENELPGRIFNGGNYAGYLIWRLSPEKYKVFTDNRYDIYGGEFIQQERIVLSAFEGDDEAEIPNWQDVLERWNVRTLFIPSDCPLNDVLERGAAPGAGDWRLRFDDNSFAIWTVAGDPEPAR